MFFPKSGHFFQFLEKKKKGESIESFKDRFYNHTKSFSHEHYANDTELSKEYWDIKRSNFILNLEHRKIISTI